MVKHLCAGLRRHTDFLHTVLQTKSIREFNRNEIVLNIGLKMLENKVALVTGGASGIGKSAAVLFSKYGAKIVIADIDSMAGEKTVSQIRDMGNAADFIKTDVGDERDVKNMVHQIIQKHGRLDCAFNNAGIITPPNLLTECSEEEWDKAMRINSKGVWLCLKYEIPEMVQQGGGAIVNMSSQAGQVAIKKRVTYCVSKSAVNGLTKVAAIEFADKNIRVNAICPGNARTPMMDQMKNEDPEFFARRLKQYPIGRFAEPDELSETAAWLLSDKSSFVTGHLLTVDGGFTLGPANG